MKKQNYSNHVRWYPAHHFVFYPLIIVGIVVAIAFGLREEQNKALWFFLAALVALTGALSFMLRQHYSLVNQNRIVRLELRLRYYILTHKRFEEVEAKLSAGQIFALRFASDEELAALTERALKENLSSDQIKKAIQNWLPDEMRV